MEQGILETAAQHKKRVVGFLLLISLIIVAWLLFWYFYKPVLTITITGTDGDFIIKTSSAEFGNVLTNKQFAQGTSVIKMRVDPGEYSLSAENQGKVVSLYAEVGAFERKTLELNLQPQKSVTKTGRESLGCDGMHKSILFSYSCTQSGQVYRHTSSKTDFVDPVAVSRQRHKYPTSRYNQGMISLFFDGTEDKFRYLNLTTGKITNLAGSNATDTNNIEIVTSVGDEKFLLIHRQSYSAQLYDSVNDNSPEDIGLGDILSKTKGFKNYALKGDKLYIYDGKPVISSDEDDEIKEISKIKDNLLHIYNLSTKSIERTVKLPKDITAATLDVFNNDLVGFSSQSSYRLYHLTEDQADLVMPLRSVVSVVSANNKLYYVQENAIYEFDFEKRTSHLVFTETQVQISRLFVSGNVIHFNGFIKGDSESVLHSYSVSEKNVQGVRPEAFLPYTTASSLPISRMDYGNDFIKVQLQLSSFGSDQATGEIFYEESELKKAKAEVLSRLKADGIDVKAKPVYFSL